MRLVVSLYIITIKTKTHQVIKVILKQTPLRSIRTKHKKRTQVRMKQPVQLPVQRMKQTVQAQQRKMIRKVLRDNQEKADHQHQPSLTVQNQTNQHQPSLMIQSQINQHQEIHRHQEIQHRIMKEHQIKTQAPVPVRIRLIRL
ncbi:hypothetical protein UZ35_10475 [Heyndrickxia coagulans]|nr:hypothetical protein IE89_13990 [Heyndrickxia coagulans]KXT20276.1 hypothetical protein UZ35_10475 [Heyndrickxia coagulans]